MIATKHVVFAHLKRGNLWTEFVNFIYNALRLQHSKYFTQAWAPAYLFRTLLLRGSWRGLGFLDGSPGSRILLHMHAHAVNHDAQERKQRTSVFDSRRLASIFVIRMKNGAQLPG